VFIWYIFTGFWYNAPGKNLATLHHACHLPFNPQIISIVARPLPPETEFPRGEKRPPKSTVAYMLFFDKRRSSFDCNVWPYKIFIYTTTRAGICPVVERSLLIAVVNCTCKLALLKLHL
jgi:hypothetical protein